ncbi:MAG: aminoacyl-tRNA hydrolase [Elusimicrobia bacterium]|nr:aminoacyl-tRNA hydrolase [Elusimicrobiota bacterium]
MVRRVTLAVFLGNPGREYEATRHNIGFMLGDLAAQKLAPQFFCSAKKGGGWRDWRGAGLYLEARRNGQKLYLLKPTTFMNASGEAAQSLAGFYKIPPEETLTVSDDISLPFGRLRVRAGGSFGGHRGISSLITALGTQEFPRLRLGIGPRPARMDAKDFVLGKFSKEEAVLLPAFLGRALEALEAIMDLGTESAMNRYNNVGDTSIS